MADDDKPFACSEHGCGMRFANEDHLSVHKMKHAMSLPLTPGTGNKPGGGLLFVADQTPTPTKFLRNCEEIGLFSELNKNPFEDAFRKAAAADANSNEQNQSELHTVTITVPSLTSMMSLNTPNLSSTAGAREPEYIPLPGPDSDAGSTLNDLSPAAIAPGMGRPTRLSDNNLYKNDTAIDLRVTGSSALPSRQSNALAAKLEPDLEKSPAGQVETPDDDLLLISDSSVSTSNAAQLVQPITTVVQTTPISSIHTTSVLASLPSTSVGVTTATNVITQPIIVAKPVTTQPVALFSPTQQQPLQQPQQQQQQQQQQQPAKVMMQVLLQLPSGEMVPFQVPTAMVSSPVAIATTASPIVAATPASASLITTTPSEVTTVPVAAVRPQTLQIKSEVAPGTSLIANTPTMSAKQKLKAAITQNVQQSVLNNNLRVMSEAVDRVTAQPGAQPTLIRTQGGILQVTTPIASPSTTVTPDSSPGSSPRVQMSAADTSTPFNRVRRLSSDDDPDDRRRKFLERNRAAAARCRNKRKQWIGNLEVKADELQNLNVKLQTEVNMLRSEVAQLKTLLLAHKDCPIFIQQKHSGQLNFETVSVPEVKQEEAAPPVKKPRPISISTVPTISTIPVSSVATLAPSVLTFAGPITVLTNTAPGAAANPLPIPLQQGAIIQGGTILSLIDKSKTTINKS